MKKIKLSFMVIMMFLLMSNSSLALTSTQMYIAAVKNSVDYGQKAEIVGYIWPADVSYDYVNGLNDLTLACNKKGKGAKNWTKLIDIISRSVTAKGITYNGVVYATASLEKNSNFQVIFAGDQYYASSQSNSVNVTVKPKVSLSGSFDDVNQKVNLRGKLRPKHKSKKAIIIKIKKSGQKNYTNIAEVGSDASGNFKYSWPYSLGRYSFIAVFKGDNDHAKSTSNAFNVSIAKK